ncbi:MAG TPA: M90 family metallopeptidase [Kofleriaceae bacterium]|nr:M90 family metallopeptidase [Kofleriaceae bacterium]
MLAWLRARRRRRILAQPFPPEWDRYIDDNVAIARRLDAADRAKLRELVQVFVAEKHWEGCGGLALTEEHQVTIAAQACLLILGRDDERLYNDVASILVYPSIVITRPRPLGLFEQPRAPIAHGHTIKGEAMLGGPVVLAWDEVLAGGREELVAGGNVVFHEFAHKLDMASGRVNGTPPLSSRAELRRWAEVCGEAYRLHGARVDAGVPTLMDAYGAKNEAEFFAVATETYFTRPYALAYEYPALYALLADFYQLRFRVRALPPLERDDAQVVCASIT